MFAASWDRSGSARMFPQEDMCAELCLLYTADGRGNGFDLCDAPEASTCNSEFICTNLYWSVTEAGALGLVYETDPLFDQDLRPLTCSDAGDIVRTPPAPIALLQVTLQILIHLPFMDRLVGDLIHDHNRRISTNGTMIIFPAPHAILDDVSRTEPTLRSIEQLMDLFTVPSSLIAEHQPFGRCCLCGDPWCYRTFSHDVAIQLQELVDLSHQESFEHRDACQFCAGFPALYNNHIRNYRTPPPPPAFTGYQEDVVMIRFPHPRNISYPFELHIENDPHTYQLVALAHMDRFANHPFADVLRNGTWYRTSGNVLLPRELGNNTAVSTVTSAYYARCTD